MKYRLWSTEYEVQIWNKDYQGIYLNNNFYRVSCYRKRSNLRKRAFFQSKVNAKLKRTPELWVINEEPEKEKFSDKYPKWLVPLVYWLFILDLRNW